MADQGLENALITAIAYEVKDPSAILKKDRESSVHLLDLVRQLLGNASSTQTASLKHVCIVILILYLQGMILMDHIVDDITSCFSNVLCIWDWG